MSDRTKIQWTEVTLPLYNGTWLRQKTVQIKSQLLKLAFLLQNINVVVRTVKSGVIAVAHGKYSRYSIEIVRDQMVSTLDAEIVNHSIREASTYKNQGPLMGAHSYPHATEIKNRRGGGLTFL
ncbi:MAG: hypothetical protein ACYDBH_21275 [Acidobacteriaceae bacterium]